MDLQRVIIDNVKAAKKILGTLMIRISVKTLVSQGYNNTTGEVTRNETVIEFDTVIDTFTDEEKGEANFSTSDIKLIVLPNTDGVFDIKPKDTVQMGNVTYNIKKATPVYAGQQIAIYTLVLTNLGVV
jgi:hypothetical protein